MTKIDLTHYQVGETVITRIDGQDVLCTVAFRGDPKKKFLTYRVNGEIEIYGKERGECRELI